MSQEINHEAVDNFVESVDTDFPKKMHFLNLYHDAKLYRWNAATVREIEKSIERMYDKERHIEECYR